MDEYDRAFGSLLGLAVGDAVGTTVEGMPPGSFEEVTDMMGGGKFSLLPGQWTDDTSMALCLAESLIHCKGFNPIDQAKRYWNWYQEGHLSSNGECFDIGMCTRKALHKFDMSKQSEPYCGGTSDQASGNGSLMRLCPVPILYHKHPMAAMNLSKESSRVTHGGAAALEACQYFAGLLVGCFQGAGKQQLLSPLFSPVAGYWEKNPLLSEVAPVAEGSFTTKQPPDIKGSGYVVKSLEAALWAFNSTSTFKDGCLLVVNLGNDADTTAAIYGQIAGAYYGASGIPEEWRRKCSLYHLIEIFAQELVRQSSNIVVPLDTKQTFPSPQSELPDAYKLIKSAYDLLEKGNKEIVRKLKPCPKQYKSLEDFDQDVSTLVGQYKSLPAAAQHSGLLADFQNRWQDSRDKLSIRLQRKF